MPNGPHRTAPMPAYAAPPEAAPAPEAPTLTPASAEARLKVVTAEITEIGKQLESKGRKGRRAWASDPQAEWRKRAMQARDALLAESKTLRAFLERARAEQKQATKNARAVEDLKRQEVARASREALALTDEAARALWDVYLRAEIALLTLVHAGTDVGPLGDSLLLAAQRLVPEWYREHWLRSVYGTTWGREAQRARAGRPGEGAP